MLGLRQRKGGRIKCPTSEGIHPTLVVTPLTPFHFTFFPIMQTMFTVNNKQISHKDLNIVRDFFTDEQWDCIYDAVSEYQDFPEKEEITRDTISVINQVFTSSY